MAWARTGWGDAFVPLHCFLWEDTPWVSGEREQRLVSELRLARNSDAPSESYRLVTSFKSWGKYK